MQVDELASVGQRLETMREALRDEQASPILGRQSFCVPAQESGRVASQVHRDIEDLSLQATDEFVLRMRRILEVEPPCGASPSCEGMVDLADCKRMSRVGERTVAVKAAEEPARVLPGETLDQHQTAKRRRLDPERAVGHVS